MMALMAMVWTMNQSNDYLDYHWVVLQKIFHVMIITSVGSFQTLVMMMTIMRMQRTTMMTLSDLASNISSHFPGHQVIIMTMRTMAMVMMATMKVIEMIAKLVEFFWAHSLMILTGRGCWQCLPTVSDDGFGGNSVGIDGELGDDSIAFDGDNG